MNIADLHCDLLSYLAEDPRHTAHDLASHVSLTSMQAGGVVLQALPIYTGTEKGSAASGSAQAEIYFQLPQKYPIFGSEIKTALSIENGSGFCEEDEPLEKGLKRLEGWLKKAGKIAYISMTWNNENRFGGGNATKAGLKSDGLELLRWMDGKKIAIDLSHASDRLAEDILEAIQDLDIIPIASHSNFRSIANHPRNLPDTIAREIGSRGGVIGLNFVRVFLGKSGTDDFLRQAEHAEKLGLLDCWCMGADFFSDSIIPPELEYLKPMFNPGFDNAACYPRVIELLLKHLSHDIVEKVAYRTLSQFLGSL